MSVIRNMKHDIADIRDRIVDLETHECERTGTSWPFAIVLIALILASFTYCTKPVSDASVDCVKAGGEWFAGSCRRARTP